VGLLFVSVQSKHRNSLFGNKPRKTEKNEKTKRNGKNRKNPNECLSRQSSLVIDIVGIDDISRLPRQILQQVAPNQEKPHTTPLHSLIYSIYISVGRGDEEVNPPPLSCVHFSVCCFASYQTVSVGLLFVSVQSKHRNSLFRY
jgi:hypothetical protein